jgi:hypothetical protein
MKNSESQITMRICLCAGLAFILAFALATFYVHALDRLEVTDGRWLRERIQQSLAYLKSTSSDHRRILVIGASDVEVGIDPMAVDAEFSVRGLKTETLNFGFPNFDPKLIHLLSRRICKTQMNESRKLDLVAVAFTPLRTTNSFADAVSRFQYFRNFLEIEAALYSPSMLMADWRAQFDEVMEVGIVKYLYSGISPNATSGLTFDNLEKLFPNKTSGDPRFILANELLRDLWYRREFLPNPPWDSNTRGAFFFGYPQTKAALDLAYERYQDPFLKAAFLRLHQRFGDVYGLHFSDEFLNEEVAALLELKKCSRQVALLFIPDSDLIFRREDARARLKTALETIVKKADVKLIDLREEQALRPEDYLDYLHLNLQGRQKAAVILANDMADILQGATL